MPDEQSQAEGHQIPETVISRWLSIAEDQEIAIHITRGAFDHLFFAVRDLQNAAYSLKIAAENMQPPTPVETGNVAPLLNIAQQHIVSSSDRLSRMMEYVMATAEVLK